MPNKRKEQVKLRRRIRRIVLSTLWVLIFIYLTLSLIFGESGLLRYIRLKSSTAKLEAQVNLIKRQNEEIKRQSEALKEDPNLIEEFARQHGLMREGELIFKYEDAR